MANFSEVSGDLNYSFSFAAKTGANTSWKFSLIYDSGSDSEFESPTLSQYIPNELGSSYSMDQSNTYLAIGDPNSGAVDIYLNPHYLYNATGTPLTNNSSFKKLNRLTGEGTGVVSGFGDKLKLINNFIVVGAKNSNDNSGTVFGFYNYNTSEGGGGATGNNNWNQAFEINGTTGSGYFGSAVNAIKNSSLHLVAASATGEFDGSGAVYLYDNDGNEFLKKLAPSGDQIAAYGKSLQFLFAQNVSYIGVGFEQGGTGKVDLYKESTPGEFDYQLSQTLQSQNPSNGDMFGYSLEGDSDYFVVGAPKELNSGAAYHYQYNAENGTFDQKQRIVPSDLSVDNNFGKNVCFDGSNGIITSDKDSGKGYIYHQEDGEWQNISAVSGVNNTIDGSFGGNISGSYSTVLIENVLTIGSSSESGSYFFTTGGADTDLITGLYFSGNQGKIYDQDGHFIYGYTPVDTYSVSGSMSTGHYNMIIKNHICNSYISKPNIQINGWKLSGEENLNSYSFSIFKAKR